MAKISTISNAEGGDVRYLFRCPGCNESHGISDKWRFNNDFDRPHIEPSILVNPGRQNPTAELCHMFVRDGKIEFLSDCTHALAGQTVEMVDWDDV